MSINTAQRSGIYNGRRDTPAILGLPQLPYVNNNWTRPSDWLALPELTATEQKFAGLLAVTPDEGNYLALTAEVQGAVTGTGVISNGDGNLPGNVLSAGSSISVLWEVGMYLSATQYITEIDIAEFTATISGTTLTVNGVTSGTIALGMTINASGGVVYIKGFISGTGGTGTYLLSSFSSGTASLGKRWLLNAPSYNALGARTATWPCTVDWGDGVVENFGGGYQVNHNYNYTTISDTTISTLGYKQVIVTITPTVNRNLQTINLGFKYTGPEIVGTLSNNPHKFIDIIMGSPYMSVIGLGGSLQAPNWLQQFKLISCTFNINFGTLFSQCILLQSISLPVCRPTNVAGMFQTCRSLIVAPMIDTSICTSTSNMFSTCTSLREVPVYNTEQVTDFSSMFADCSALTIAPMLDTSKGTAMNTMFNNCFALVSVPAYNTSKVTNVNNMFFNCNSLTTVPFFDMSKVSSAFGMFERCYALRTIPAYNLSACVNPTGMFSRCYSLFETPPLNLSAATSINTMFTFCYGLIKIGDITTSSVLTSMSQTFGYCSSLIYAPNVSNTLNVNNMFELFYQCFSMQTVPFYNTSKVTTMQGMFGYTYALQSVPEFDTGNVTTVSRMFNASGLVNAPNFNTVKVTDASSFFYLSKNLVSIPAYNFSAVTNINAFVQDCPLLTSIPDMPTTGNCLNFTNMAYGSGIKYTGVINTTKSTNSAGMFFQCAQLVSVPALQYQNNTIATSFSGCNSLSELEVVGTKVSLNVQNCKLNQNALGVVINNITGNTTVQTLTITANPGADTPVSKASTVVSIASTTINMANTAGVLPGMICLGTNLSPGSYSVTFTAADDSINLTNHGLANGTKVSFNSIVTTTGLALHTVYYVVNSTTNTFKVSTTLGGPAIDLVNNGTGTVRYAIYVEVVNTNANIIISDRPYGSGTITATFRNLDVGPALLKNWTVTG